MKSVAPATTCALVTVALRVETNQTEALRRRDLYVPRPHVVENPM